MTDSRAQTQKPAYKPKVLFVCLGNICRSPTAEAIFKAYAKQGGLKLDIDSAGTSGWHQGEAPDPRAIEAGQDRGYSFEGQSSRKIEANDFVIYDYILAMDNSNLETLQQTCPDAYHHKLQLFLDYAPHLSVREVPDPYYGGAGGFEHVISLIEAASQGLVDALQTSASKPA